MSQLQLEQIHLPPNYLEALELVCDKFNSDLGDNLYSCILYGSAVRGGIVNKVSDLNLLLILNESTPNAHRVIAKAIQGKVVIHPFVIAIHGIEKSFNSFAIKFNSIKRNYRVLLGRDPFDLFSVGEETLLFLTEQALRNLRYRSVYNYITLGEDRKRYLNYLIHVTPQVFTDIGEALRVRGIPVPNDFSGRIPVIKSTIGEQTAILSDMLLLRNRSIGLSESEVFEFHTRLYTLLDKIISWLSK